MAKNKKSLLLSLCTVSILVGLFIKQKSNELLAPQKSETQRKSSQSRDFSPNYSGESSGLQGDRLLVEKALADLAKTLPSWMAEKGMMFEDRREVFGQTILRSRARHEWGDGKQMEIEISDLGVVADEDVIKALGFDLKMEERNDESGVQEVDDGQEQVLSNYEYNFADQAGSLQVLFGSRYFIEIQLEGLPEASFQEILDQDIAFDELYQTSPFGE